MNEKDIKDIENVDFDIIENTLVALRELWKKRLLIVLVTIAGLLIALIIISIKGSSVRYYSSATLFSAVYGSYSESNEGVVVMNRYSDLIKSSRVCNRAAQSLARYGITSGDLKEMVANGSIRVGGASKSATSYGYQLIISVYAESEQTVLPITNAMASAFAEELNDLIGSSAIQVMDEAVSYSSFNTLNVAMYLLLFPAAAFVGICGLIFVLAFLSPWASSVAQCEQDKDLILGMLPYTRK